MIGNGHVQFCSGRRWRNLPPDRNRVLLEGQVGPAEVSAEVAAAEIGPEEVSGAEVGSGESDPSESGLGEVRRDVLVPLPPLIPRLDTLLQDLEMLGVGHRSRLPLSCLCFSQWNCSFGFTYFWVSHPSSHSPSRLPAAGTAQSYTVHPANTTRLQREA